MHPAANATESGSIFGKSVKTILVNRDDSKASMADGKNVKTITAILRVNAKIGVNNGLYTYN